MLIDLHVYALLCLHMPTDVSLPSPLCGDIRSEGIKNVLSVYKPSNSLQPPSFPLPASFPGMETWISQLANYYNVLRIAGIYVFNLHSSRMSDGASSILNPSGLYR